MPPSKQEIEVALSALRTEAKSWDGVAESLDRLADKAKELELGRLEAGIFQLLVAPANNASAKVVQRCREGVAETRKIGDALRKVADVYEEEEAKNLHAIKKLY